MRPVPKHRLRRCLRGFDPLSMVLWTPHPVFSYAPSALAAGYDPAPTAVLIREDPLLRGYAWHFPGCSDAAGVPEHLEPTVLEHTLASLTTRCPWCTAHFAPLYAHTLDPALAWVLHTTLVHVALDHFGDLDLALRTVHSAWLRGDTHLARALALRTRAAASPRRAARVLRTAPAWSAHERTEVLALVDRHDHDARWAWAFPDHGTPTTAAFVAPAWLAAQLRTLRIPLRDVQDPHALAALIDAGVSLSDAVLLTR